MQKYSLPDNIETLGCVGFNVHYSIRLRFDTGTPSGINT
jgi:hypothetical protein